jgi:alkylation response protein AidB-like acyl-CoA dehydrogenase
MTSSVDLDQQEWRRTARDFFAAKSPEAAVRRLAATPEGYDPEVWRQLSDQLGLQGLIIPEEYGGSGFGLVELGVVLEEMGRNLFCGPFLSSAVIAATALLRSADEDAKARYLPGIAEGTTIATLAFGERSAHRNPPRISTRAETRGSGWRLWGEERFVGDGHIADLLLVVAAVDGSPGLFAVEGTAAELGRVPIATMDQTQRAAHIGLTGAPAARIDEIDVGAMLLRVQSIAAACIAAGHVGGMQQALDLAVEYATVRVQYGRPIGSFQAIKHRCADMLVALETSRAVAAQALAAIDREDPALDELASLALVRASEAYLKVAGDSIQIHGGIGVTWEHPLHFHFKRVKASASPWGSLAEHRARITEAIGI